MAKSMLRSALRQAKARALRFHAEKTPVVVFGLRRGGSTMLTDAISANPGVWFANEPFAMFPGRPGYDEKSARLFKPMHSHYFDLSADQLEAFAAFSNDLLAARLRTVGTARQTLSGLRANRSCLKILNAPWMLNWFRDNTSAFVISAVRHPGAQARSVLRQGWAFPAEAYLARPELLSGAFSASQLALARDIMAKADPWSCAVLDWVITSHPLRHAQGQDVVATTYEAVVRDPARFIDDVLMARAGLEDREAMLEAIRRPSGSSRLSTSAANQAIEAGDLDTILEGWRHKTTAQEHERGQKILDAFDIDMYRFGLAEPKA